MVSFFYYTMFFARGQLQTYCQSIHCCPIQLGKPLYCSNSLLIFFCQSVTYQQTTFAYPDEEVYAALDYVNMRPADFNIRDSDVTEPVHCASRCWCLLEWKTAGLADPRMRDTIWGCKLGQWQRLFHCLNYTLDEQVTWQLPPITLYIPTIWESSLSLFGL